MASSTLHIEPTPLLSHNEFEELLQTAARALNAVAHPGEVRIRLVADDEMAKAHERYSGIPGTTDVLTFDLSEGATTKGDPLDVDILICVDEASRQAQQHGHDRGREILLYILHGVMHCMGHDDHTDEGFARMHAEEDRILTAIGVGPTFFTPHQEHDHG